MTEYLAENSRLKQASRQYAKGQISLEDFRQLRWEMIDALEAGQVGQYQPEEEDGPVDSLSISPASLEGDVLYKTMPPNTQVAAEVEAALNPEAPAVADWDNNTRILAIVLAVALLIALSTLVYVFVL